LQDDICQMPDRETSPASTAEIRLADALECSGEGIVLATADGTVDVVNNQVAAFFPKSAQLIASGHSLISVLAAMEQELLPPDDLNSNLERYRLGDAQYTGAIERQLPTGVWIRFHGSQTRDGGFILMLSDFTAIKEREELYRKAKTEAELASTAKSRFLANMSHELRTPLNAIIGFSEVIAGEMFGELGNPRYLEYSTDILRSGRHLLDVIDSVIDIAKTETGRMDLKAEAVDLGYVLLDCTRMMRDQCISAGVTLTMQPILQSLIVNGEKAKLRQIFLNLLSNACRFTEPGGAIHVQVLHDDPNTIAVQVKDTGIGMSAEDIAVALTPFGQVDSKMERRFQGTGLGLPLTKALVDLHSGVLAIASEKGKGTTVTVRFPNADILADNDDNDLIAIVG
jgi:signal transduction histidine kinase